MAAYLALCASLGCQTDDEPSGPSKAHAAAIRDNMSSALDAFRTLGSGRMARTRRDWRTYSAGECGRKRVRVFSDPKTGMFRIEWRESGRKLRRSLKHRDWRRAKGQADEFAAGFVGPEIEGKPLWSVQSIRGGVQPRLGARPYPVAPALAGQEPGCPATAP